MNKKPTFNILHKGVRVETLIHCFLHRMPLKVQAIMPHSVKAKNGEEYEIVWDFPLPESYTESYTTEVIISFQKHTYGNFAVIRAAHPPIPKQGDLTFLPFSTEAN